MVVKYVELTKKEIEELQEKLMLVYRFISQKNMFERFYYQGVEVKSNLNNNSLINKLMELDESEELLKSCIIELEDMKSEYNKNSGESLSPVEFQDFINNQEWNQLYKKYGMKTLDHVGKLDLEMLLELI